MRPLHIANNPAWFLFPLVVLCGCAVAGEPTAERWYVGEPPYGEDVHADDEDALHDYEGIVHTDNDSLLFATQIDDEPDLAGFVEEDPMVEEMMEEAFIERSDEFELVDDTDEVDFFAAANPPVVGSVEEAASSSTSSPEGGIDRVYFNGNMKGWACDKKAPQRTVEVVLRLRDKYGKLLETKSAMADLDSGYYVEDRCGGGTAHRFHVNFETEIPCGAWMGLSMRGVDGELHYVRKRKLRCNPIGETFMVTRSGIATGWACDLNRTDVRNYVTLTLSKGTNRTKRTHVANGRWVASRCSGSGIRHRFKFDIGRSLKCEEVARVYSRNVSGTPGARKVLIGKRTGPTCSPGTSSHVRPIKGAPITSRFGMRWHPVDRVYKLHTGTDFGASSGSRVRASQAGRVVMAGWNGGYGRMVAINHGNGVVTRYAHLSRISVSKGQVVSKLQIIGRVGSSGKSTGPHLHFEYMRNGRFKNPMNILP